MFGSARIDALSARVRRLEELTEMLMKNAGMEMPLIPGVPDDVAREIRDYIDRREKIKAIILYREATGAGLKESKEFIDSMG